jgi:hypothetical protein
MMTAAAMLTLGACGGAAAETLIGGVAGLLASKEGVTNYRVNYCS